MALSARSNTERDSAWRHKPVQDFARTPNGEMLGGIDTVSRLSEA